MSGRQFEYKQFLVGDIIDSLEELINKKMKMNTVMSGRVLAMKPLRNARLQLSC